MKNELNIDRCIRDKNSILTASLAVQESPSKKGPD